MGLLRIVFKQLQMPARTSRGSHVEIGYHISEVPLTGTPEVAKKDAFSPIQLSLSLPFK